MRVLGLEHANTLLSAHSLPACLMAQEPEKYAKAELEQAKRDSELHTGTVNVRVLGPEHPSTLSSAYSLCQALYY